MNQENKPHIEIMRHESCEWVSYYNYLQLLEENKKLKEELKESYEIDREVIKELVPSIINPKEGVANSWLEKQLAILVMQLQAKLDVAVEEKLG